MRFVLITVLLLCASCGSDTVTPTALHVAPTYPHVSSETAARYAKGLAKGAWTELELVSKEEAFANIHSHLQAFSDMTGCSVVASRRRQFSRIEYAELCGCYVPKRHRGREVLVVRAADHPRVRGSVGITSDDMPD
jgi:hypothetical protein